MFVLIDVGISRMERIEKPNRNLLFPVKLNITYIVIIYDWSYCIFFMQSLMLNFTELLLIGQVV